MRIGAEYPHVCREEGVDCRIRSGNGECRFVIARSASDEAIQGPLALSAGLLRCARNDGESMVLVLLTNVPVNTTYDSLARREGRHLQRRLLTERARVLRAEASHFCSQAAWASCPSGTCSDCEVLAALAPERECRTPVCIR
jgi:hypothetical protein